MLQTQFLIMLVVVKVFVYTDLVTNYSCKCNTGYSGSACNIKDQVCLASPCLNGATFTDLGGLNYTFECPIEYDRINCQNRN